MTPSAVLLFLSSCAIAVMHALIPDHWLPFVLLGRVKGWGRGRTTLLTGLAGLLHVLVSIAVGALAIVFGSGSAQSLAARTGRSLENLGGLLLVVFGIVYGIGSHLREARAHRGRPAGDPGAPVHTHGHLLGRWFRGALTGGALVVVIGLSPCAMLVPILFTASAQGTAAVVASGLGFAACTIATTVVVARLAARGLDALDLPFLTRYGDLTSGALIAALGLVVMLLED